ncbi:MAG: HIT domain-containing protein [bacterium]
MLYKELLEIERSCPFCGFEDTRTIKQGLNSYLTYSLAPYCKHHLLVIPNRHVEFYEDLNKAEKEDIEELLSCGTKYLKALGHEGYSILLRNGKSAGKSIPHLHYHLIPSIEVGSIENNSRNREIMTET